MVDRRPGLSVRVKLTLSYAALVMVAGVLLLATVWRFLLYYIPSQGRPGPGPFTPSRADLLDAFTPRAGQALLFLLAFALLGGWVLAGRMLAPLSRITTATRKVAAGSLSHRIELEGPHDELRELADSFDAMVARLEAHVDEQRRFAANASHELRTPLAITQALLDVARQEPDRNPAELVDRLHAVNARAIDLTEALLLLSRADRRSFAREPVDLSLLAEEATETLLPLAEERGLSLTAAGAPATTTGSHALLQQLTTNLVHNAIVHNLPEGGAVWVTTGTDHSGAHLTVQNTGQPLSPHRVATLVEPFQRGTERARSRHAGVGLGLAIADSITRAHDGTLWLEPRPGGGLTATVTLPATLDATA